MSDPVTAVFVVLILLGAWTLMKPPPAKKAHPQRRSTDKGEVMSTYRTSVAHRGTVVFVQALIPITDEEIDGFHRDAERVHRRSGVTMVILDPNMRVMPGRVPYRWRRGASRRGPR